MIINWLFVFLFIGGIQAKSSHATKGRDPSSDYEDYKVKQTQKRVSFTKKSLQPIQPHVQKRRIEGLSESPILKEKKKLMKRPKFVKKFEQKVEEKLEKKMDKIDKKLNDFPKIDRKPFSRHFGKPKALQFKDNGHSPVIYRTGLIMRRGAYLFGGGMRFGSIDLYQERPKKRKD